MIPRTFAFLALSSILFAPPVAAYETTTFTEAFGTLHSTGDLPLSNAPFTRTLQLPLFGNPQVQASILRPSGYDATLTGVHIAYEASLSSQGWLRHDEPDAPALGGFNVFLFRPWQVSFGPPMGMTEVFGTAGTDLIDHDSGGYNIPPNGGEWETGRWDVDDSGLLDLIMIDPDDGWFEDGLLDVTFSLGAIASVFCELENGTCIGGDSSSETGTYGEVSIYYDYDLRPQDAPAPAPLGLIALGLGALGLRRYRPAPARDPRGNSC